jgi:probable addiction module antidote protein
MVKLQPFDSAQHLDNPEVINCYLGEALESGDVKLFLRAVQNVARANNMSKIAREIGMSRTSLYWGENTSPEFTTVLRLLEKLGMRLRVEPIADAPRPLGFKRLIRAAREGVVFGRGEPEAVLPWHAESYAMPSPRAYVPAGVLMHREAKSGRIGKKVVRRKKKHHPVGKKMVIGRKKK